MVRLVQHAAAHERMHDTEQDRQHPLLYTSIRQRKTDEALESARSAGAATA